MARSYRLGFRRRLVNRLVGFGVRHGWGKGFFDAAPGDPLAAFEAEAVRHPVFRLDPLM